MKVKTWAAIAATTAGLGAAPAVAQEQGGQQGGQQGQGGQPGPGRQQGGQAQQQAAVRAFLRASARSNLFEIQSSELALQRARSSETRRLARLLIRHHTAMQTVATDVAQAQDVQLPTTLDSRQRSDLARLQRTQRRTFDRTFLRIQVVAHRLAIRVHLTAARAELPDPVRLLAIEGLPVIGDHLGRASALLERQGGSGGSGGGESGSGSDGQGGESGSGANGQGGNAGSGSGGGSGS